MWCFTQLTKSNADTPRCHEGKTLLHAYSASSHIACNVAAKDNPESIHLNCLSLQVMETRCRFEPVYTSMAILTMIRVTSLKAPFQENNGKASQRLLKEANPWVTRGYKQDSTPTVYFKKWFMVWRALSNYGDTRKFGRE